MPFDGIVAKCVTNELNEIIVGGRVEKIFQPEADEIHISIRSKGENLKLVLSASSNYPRIHLTTAVKENPSAPPVFCMLLRKHLSGGRIVGVGFHDFERIITVQIESTNELGDLSVKKLIIEIMGRHSNIILTNSEDKIIDSIKHVDNEISSKREVMPARTYVLPPSQNKTSPEIIDLDLFFDNITLSEATIEKHLLNNIKGFSPLLCSELCNLSSISGQTNCSSLDINVKERLKNALCMTIRQITCCNFKPCIIFSDTSFDTPYDFHCLELKTSPFIKYINSMSSVLDQYYAAKDRSERLKQKRSDINKVLNTNLDRCNKKLSLQQEKLRDVSDRDKLKLYGELITANIYCIPISAKKVTLLNYYSENNESIDILLDENLSVQQNAQRYFKKYTKAKSAFSNTSKQIEETKKELEYLESVLHLLDNCITLQEIDEIRQELNEEGYIMSRKKNPGKKNAKASEPLHFKSSDGFDIYVGKNNKQNDLLTLKMSSSNDFWFHVRNIPGSHVIIKKTQQNIPDRTLLEAASLAAYHSKAKISSNVPVDYTLVKNVKKPSGAKPGMVIYTTFKTIIVTPEKDLVIKLQNNII